jgi:hypothetical protein
MTHIIEVVTANVDQIITIAVAFLLANFVSGCFGLVVGTVWSVWSATTADRRAP